MSENKFFFSYKNQAKMYKYIYNRKIEVCYILYSDLSFVIFTEKHALKIR